MNDVVTAARGFIGVRYGHQGRGEKLDCAGLVIQVAKIARGSSFDFTNYHRHARDESMLALCAEHLQKVATPEPGDVLVFRFGHQRHMGIAGDYHLGGLSLIHAYLPCRQVVEVRLDETWRSRLMAAYRFPEAF